MLTVDQIFYHIDTGCQLDQLISEFTALGTSSEEVRQFVQGLLDTGVLSVGLTGWVVVAAWCPGTARKNSQDQINRRLQDSFPGCHVELNNLYGLTVIWTGFEGVSVDSRINQVAQCLTEAEFAMLTGITVYASGSYE